MQQVFSATTSAEVHLMKGVLENEGFQVEVRGDNLVGIQGEIMTRPSLWVAEADVEAAVRLLEDSGRDEGRGGAVLDRMEAQEEAEGVDAEDDEQGQEAMSELFLVADRLSHDPFRADLMEELIQLRDFVAGAHPPFGIDDQTWARVAELAAALVASQEVEDEDVFRDAAHALRDFLREYV